MAPFPKIKKHLMRESELENDLKKQQKKMHMF
jgi:hypothetical protein